MANQYRSEYPTQGFDGSFKTNQEFDSTQQSPLSATIQRQSYSQPSSFESLGMSSNSYNPSSIYNNSFNRSNVRSSSSAAASNEAARLARASYSSTSGSGYPVKLPIRTYEDYAPQTISSFNKQHSSKYPYTSLRENYPSNSYSFSRESNLTQNEMRKLDDSADVFGTVRGNGKSMRSNNNTSSSDNKTSSSSLKGNAFFSPTYLKDNQASLLPSQLLEKKAQEFAALQKHHQQQQIIEESKQANDQSSPLASDDDEFSYASKIANSSISPPLSTHLYSSLNNSGTTNRVNMPDRFVSPEEAAKKVIIKKQHPHYFSTNHQYGSIQSAITPSQEFRYYPRAQKFSSTFTAPFSRSGLTTYTNNNYGSNSILE